MRPGRGWLRTGLWLLTALQLLIGGWLYFAPHSFYTGIPTVADDPPYNEHFMTDIGGATLALAVVLGASALLLEPVLVRVALTAYLVYTVSHLAFHATHLGGISPAWRAGLIVSLSVLPAYAAALLLLARRAAPLRRGPAQISSRRPAPARRGSTPAGPGSRGRSS